MENVEFLRRVIIGIYLPTNSWLHRLDVRAKLFVFLVGTGYATFVSSLRAQGVFLIWVLMLMHTARVPWRFAWNGLKAALPFLFAFGVLDLLFAPSSPKGVICTPWWTLGSWHLTNCAVETVGLLFLRFTVLMLWTSLLTITTTVVELGRGLEWYLSPLNRWGIPGYEVSLILALTFRFVPTFALEAERLVKSQMARGIDLGEGGRWRFWRRVRAMMPMLIPFFLMALRRAEEMAEAMEARGFIGVTDTAAAENLLPQKGGVRHEC